MENDTETTDSTNGAETTENELELDLDNQGETQEEETVTIPKKKWTEALTQKEHWKKKATEKTEEKPEVKTEAKELELSAKDAVLLAKADVDMDDVDEVVDFAKYRKISIAEALKNSTLKAILADKKEERTTAQATQTRSPRQSAQVTGDVLIEKARKGEIREEDIDKLVQAEMEAKRKKS
jgi:hypothetical protein